MNNQEEAKQMLIRAMSGRSIRDVAKRSGVAEQTIKTWLNGTQPGLGLFIAVVNACGFYLKLEETKCNH